MKQNVRMKRLLFIIYSLENPRGTERVTTTLANEIYNQGGYEITIVTLYGQKSFFPVNENIRIHQMEVAHGKQSIIKKAAGLVKMINGQGYDCIIGVAMNMMTFFCAFLTFFIKPRVKFIIHEHTSFNNAGKLMRFVKQYLYKRFYKVCVLTAHDEKILQKKGVSNVIRIGNFSSIYPATIPPILTRNKWIIGIGSLNFGKGFDRMIKIWGELFKAYPGWKLLIIGDGEEKENLMQLARNYGMQEENFGIMPPSGNIGELYQQSQVFAMTSRFEGLPMVMIEALCSGCTLISYDCETGPREIIKNSISGYILKEDDQQAFVAKLDTLLKNDDLRAEISNNSLTERSEYAPFKVVKEWQKWIEK